MHRTKDDDPPTMDGYERVWFHLTDAQFSTVAVIDSNANVVERVTYTAYGRARHHWFEDVDGDGDHDTADLNLVGHLAGKRIQDTGYRAEADLDRDGVIGRRDYGLANNSDPWGIGFGHAALAEGLLSSSAIDNQIGWDGYVFNPEVETYTVRERTYIIQLARWGERDPAGYIDGMNLYEYVRTSPITLNDPFGLMGPGYRCWLLKQRYLQQPIGPFKGYEDPRYQQHDVLLRQLLLEFNANKAAWCGCIDKTAATIPDLTPELVKAWLIQESGGGSEHDKACWAVDPAQVNVPGDWVDEKGELGLTKPTQRNEGTIEQNLRAALQALCRKGFGTSYKATKGRRENATFDGWIEALRRYNGRTDVRPNGKQYRDNYCECIKKRADNPEEHVPIELP
jgi:RHS repeat-associated protein